MEALRQKLVEALNAGCRVVTYCFTIKGYKPIAQDSYKVLSNLYLYTKDSIVVDDLDKADVAQ